ncbi:MAG: transposase [Gammaproteobacteria bacterium RIFCSPLOWO2_12_FULL_42_18]|nr:MAG: transposase [Gammaproteobacteria bacterium RIFCSPLOWO2_12_FULL_42_18]
MSISIPESIFELKGQCVNTIDCNEHTNTISISCHRDKRFAPIDPVTHLPGTINCYVRRIVHDVPLLDYRLQIEIELAQVLSVDDKRHIEHCDFVDKGCYYTKRFCRLISGLCRHMTISAVAKHFGLRWETVKNIDKAYLQETLPSLNPEELTNLKYLGVDEVARAKGHDYMTLVYDLSSGQLIWVHRGRTAEVFSQFLKKLQKHTKQGILAVAMDMGLAYQKAVRDDLPNADIVFDRFHVMQNFCKAMDNQRRAEFRKADDTQKELIVGSRYLLLKNSDKLNEEQQNKLQTLLHENKNINSLYILKEQLQMLWQNSTVASMQATLETWCQLADETGMTYIKKFAGLLRRHKTGICNYAKYHLTTARIEAGNVGIGLIRKRARGIRDTEYFALKIRQLSVPEEKSIFYRKVAWVTS